MRDRGLFALRPVAVLTRVAAHVRPLNCRDGARGGARGDVAKTCDHDDRARPFFCGFTRGARACRGANARTPGVDRVQLDF